MYTSGLSSLSISGDSHNLKKLLEKGEEKCMKTKYGVIFSWHPTGYMN